MEKSWSRCLCIPKDIHIGKPFPGLPFFKCFDLFYIVTEKNQMLTGSETIG